MKRLLFLLFVAVIALSCFFVYNDSITTISNVMDITGDSKGNIYLIDNKDYKSRLIKINRNGCIDYIVNARAFKDGHFAFFADLAADSEGNVYLAWAKVNVDTYEAVHEAISMYDSRGRFVKDIYSVDTSKKELIWLSDIKSISCDGKYVYVYTAKDGWGEVFSISLDGSNAIAERVDIRLIKEELLSEVLVQDTRSTFIVSKYGEVFHTSQGDAGKLIYPEDAAEDSMPIPVDLSLDSDGRLYFTDVRDWKLIRMDLATLASETLLQKKDFIDESRNITFINLRNIVASPSGNILASCGINGKSALVVIEGTNAVIMEDFRFQNGLYAVAGAGFIAAMALIYLILYLLHEVYDKLMNKKIPILVKQLAFLIPFVIASMIVMSNQVSTYITKIVEDELYAQLYTVSQMVANRIDTEKIKQLTSPRDFLSDTYLELQSAIEVDLSEFQEQRQGGYSKYIYSEIYRYMNGEIRAVINSDGYTVSYPKKMMSEDKNQDRPYEEVYRDNKMKVLEYTDSRGIWMCCLTPLYDSGGQIVGLLETGMGKKTYLSYVNSYSNMITVLNLVVTVPMVLVLMLILFISLRPLRALQRGVNEIAAGRLDTVVVTKSRDEMGDFAKVVNKMLDHLRFHIEKITRYNEAYHRFVPQQFMSLLGRESVLDINLGECVKTDVTILSLNIRNFYRMSNEMKPEETFRYINTAFNLIAPIIRENDGIIVHYTDTGLTAFFTDGGDAGLKAAVMAQDAVKAYNEDSGEGRRELHIGTALHRGSVMLGIIGEEKRLEAAAISEDVHLADMLLELGEGYGSLVLATENYFRRVDKENFNIRNIGEIAYKGRKLNLFDCFDGDSPDIKIQKRENLEAFEKGVRLYGQGELYQTRVQFIEIVKKCPGDRMAKIYLYLSDRYLNSGKPEDWNPAINYNEQSYGSHGWEM